jgi:hypothetical protein
VEPHRKFYITPNRILDAEIVAEVEYHAVGSIIQSSYLHVTDTGEASQPKKRVKSEVYFALKNPDAESITLYGEEADLAWSNFQDTLDNSALDQLSRKAKASMQADV